MQKMWRKFFRPYVYTGGLYQKLYLFFFVILIKIVILIILLTERVYSKSLHSDVTEAFVLNNAIVFCSVF